MVSVQMKKLASFAVTILTKVSQGFSILAIVFLMAMMVVTVADVFLRYFFKSGIPGSVELIQYFMIVAGFLGVAWCAVKGGHLKVDVIVGRFPARWQALIDAITLVLAMTVVPIVAWQGFAQARYAQLAKTAADVTEIPDFPFYIVVGVGYTLLFLVLVPLLAEFIAKVMKK